MGLTRSSSGLLVRDDFGSDTSGNYYASDSKTLQVTSGYLNITVAGDCIVVDQDKTGVVITTKGYRTTGAADGCMFVDSTTPAVASANGYRFYYRASTNLWTLSKYASGSQSVLATDNDDMPGTNSYSYARCYHAAGSQLAWGGSSWPLQAALSATDTTYDATTLYDAVWLAGNRVDYLEWRSGYTITCTGLGSGSGYQLQANGSATYKATESSGTATLSVAVLEWPLTSVEVLDASNNQVAQITSGTLADMGGGDAFAYAAAATGKPTHFCHYANLRR